MKLTRIENKSIIKELVPVYINDEDIKVVNARELHKVLAVKKKFADWIKSNLKNYTGVKLTDNSTLPLNGNSEIDYIAIEIPATQGKGKSIEYILTLDTAKELAMMSKCQNGRLVRKYFIEVEKAFNNMVTTLTDEEKTPEQKIAEALILANDVLDKTKQDLLKANRNKAYNKKVNVELRRRVRELEAELEQANNNPQVNNAEIEEIKAKLAKAEEKAEYWEGAYTVMEEKLDIKETQLITILTVRQDGKKYFNLLSSKHAAAIPERDANKKSMRANIFRKESIEKCKDVKYSHSFASNFIERIHPLSIPTALNAYLIALENRLEDKFEEVIGEELIQEIKDFITTGTDSIDAVVNETALA